MIKPVRIFSGLLLSAYLAPAVAGGSLAEIVGNASYWQTMDWDNAAASTAWQDHNWVSYLGKQDGSEKRARIQDFVLAGGEWQATLSQRVGNSNAPDQLTVYTPAEDTQKDQCDALYHWSFQHFGAPHIAMDGSYRLPASAGSPEHRYTDRHYLWDLGNSRITQDCIGQMAVTPDADSQHLYAVSSLRFTAKDATPELPPLVNAKCTRTLHLSDSSDIPLKMSDIAFVIDEKNGSIRRPDLVPIRVRNVLVTHDQVRFSLTLDKSNNDYQIERPSGQLNATMSIAGIRAGAVSGLCTLTPILTAQPE